MIPAALAAILLLGFALLTLGLRGRRVDSLLYCRRCKYNLTGANAETCPECGADLSRRRATRIGRRARRRAFIAGGVTLLLISTAAAGLLAWGNWKGVNWNSYKPVWWLMRDVRGWDVDAADAAATELLERHLDERLDDATWDRLIRLALTIHADTDRTFPGELSQVIHQGLAEHRVSRDEMAQYLEHLSTPWLWLEHNSPLWPGDIIDVQFNPGWRAGKVPGNGCPFFVLHAAEVAGEEVIGFVPLEGNRWFPPQGSSPGVSAGEVVAPERPGRYTLRLLLTWEVAGIGKPAEEGDPRFDGMTVQIPLEAAFEVVAPDPNVPERVDDPALEAAIRDALHLETKPFGAGEPHRQEVLLMVSYEDMPVPLACHAFTRQVIDGKVVELPALPRFTIGEGTSRGYGMGLRVVDSSKPFDLILRPDFEYVKRNRHRYERIWARELVFENLGVRTDEEVEAE